MPMDDPELTQVSNSSLEMTSTASVAQQAQNTGEITFFNLPRELRDQIYAHLLDLKVTYTQIRAQADFLDVHLDLVDDMKTRSSCRLTFMQASRTLLEESSRILYGENIFHIHVGSTLYHSSFLTQKTADLMQNIVISLHSDMDREVLRVLRLFGTSEMTRQSCLIKLKFTQRKPLEEDTIEILKKLSGFKVLTFQLKPTKASHHARPQGLCVPWVSILFLLAYIKKHLTPVLGPSTFSNDQSRRCLTFHPQNYRGQDAGDLQVVGQSL